MAVSKTTAAKKTAATQPKKLHRTGATEKYYVNGYPTKLYIYKLAASQFWWVRYFANGNAVRKSTKSDSKQAAIEFAKEFYDTVTYNLRHGITPTKSATSFESCLKEFMKAEKAKLERGEITKITYDNAQYRYDKFITPYFRNMELRDIDYLAVERFLNKMSEEKLSSSTVHAYLGLTRKVLAYAVKRKLIASVPEFPSVSMSDKARGWFTAAEYRLLWNAASRYIGKRIEVRKYIDEKGDTQTQYINATATKGKLGELMRNVDMTEDMRRLIVFNCNSYIRPTDIKFLKHKHVDIVRGEYTYLRLRLPPTKGHKFPITTMEKAVDCYETLRDYHLMVGLIEKEHSDDFVFLPQYKTNRDYALKQLQRQFEILMDDTGMGVSAAGERRTIYSLRHTCIMYRLLYGDGINTLALARNARTSVEMIDRFYAKPLSGEMNIAMLQSRRRKRKIYDGEFEIGKAAVATKETAQSKVKNDSPVSVT